MSNQPNSKTSTWQHNTHKRQELMAPVGFKPLISETERPQTLDRATAGIGLIS
jgi:hypothetical protein